MPAAAAGSAASAALLALPSQALPCKCCQAPQKQAAAPTRPHLVVQQSQVQLPQLLQRVGQVGVGLAGGRGRAGAGTEHGQPAGARQWSERSSSSQAPLWLKPCPLQAACPHQPSSPTLPQLPARAAHLGQPRLLHNRQIIVLDTLLRGQPQAQAGQAGAGCCGLLPSAAQLASPLDKSIFSAALEQPASLPSYPDAPGTALAGSVRRPAAAAGRAGGCVPPRTAAGMGGGRHSASGTV